MPILAPETSIYPASLLDEPNRLLDEHKWWAIHTKPRQEKSLARELLQQEIPFYLPLVAKNRLMRGRKVESYIPLFTSYVFLCGSDEQRVESLKTNRVAYTLEVTQGEELRKDLRQVQQII
ncbi:MAG: UpxY family transcription antiterminator, partial [Pirellulales bacterium]